MKKVFIALFLLLIVLLAACGQGGSDAPVEEAAGGQDGPQITVFKSPA